MKKSTRQKGKLGEDIALRFLEKKGYILVSRNVTFRAGEIDLVTSKNGILIFVEVKARWGTQFGNAQESFNSHKKYKLLRAIREYVQKNQANTMQEWRCDLITLDFQTTHKATIQHFTDVYSC